jgi:acylglycerol lipase
MGAYHIAFRQAAPWIRKDRVDDVRWALSALDPRAGRVRYGAFAASDGAEVPYRLWLPKTAPRAAILLLHGCCDYSGAFDDIAPKLVKRGFACLAYDQRGFGATASRGQWMGQERIVADVTEAVGFFRTRIPDGLPLFIIGESMGGSVAVHAAASNPDLGVDGLVLVAPGALASTLRNTLYNMTMRVLRFFAGQSEIVVERTNGDELSAAAAIRLMGDPMVMQAIRAELLSGVIAMGYAAVGAAAKVTVPTLTLAATKDDVVREFCVRQLHANLAGEKDWSAIKDAPHLLLHWRRGNVVLRRVRRWIDRMAAPHMEQGAEASVVPRA